MRFDRREGLSPREYSDHGWIGEDALGIWLRRHPEAVLSEREHLWPIVARWRSSSSREITPAEAPRFTHFFLTCWAAMQGAAYRRTAAKPGAPGD